MTMFVTESDTKCLKEVADKGTMPTAWLDATFIGLMVMNGFCEIKGYDLVVTEAGKKYLEKQEIFGETRWDSKT